MGLWSSFTGWVSSKMRERRAMNSYLKMQSLIKKYNIPRYRVKLLNIERRYMLIVKELNHLIHGYSSKGYDNPSRNADLERSFNEAALLNLGRTGATKMIRELEEKTLTDIGTLYNEITDVLSYDLPKPVLRELERERSLLARFIKVDKRAKRRSLQDVMSARRKLWGIKEDGTSSAPTSRNQRAA